MPIRLPKKNLDKSNKVLNSQIYLSAFNKEIIH